MRRNDSGPTGHSGRHVVPSSAVVTGCTVAGGGDDGSGDTAEVWDFDSGAGADEDGAHCTVTALTAASIAAAAIPLRWFTTVRSHHTIRIGSWRHDVVFVAADNPRSLHTTTTKLGARSLAEFEVDSKRYHFLVFDFGTAR
jgi:hypothetical protein